MLRAVMRDEEKTKEELISELKALRASAWEDKERWRFAIEGGVDGIWEWNVQTREVFYSRTIKDMFGYEEDEIGTQLDEWMKRIHPDDVKAVMEHIDKFLKGEQPVRGTEHRIRCKDDTYRWAFLRGKVVSWTEDGKPLIAVGTFTDIDKRKRMEEALRESENKFRGLTEKSVAGIYLIQDDILHYVNAKFSEIFGYTIDEITGTMKVDFLVSPEDRPMVVENLRKRTSGKLESLNYEFRGITKKGDVRIVEAYSSLTSYRGRPAIIGTILDITERRLAEEMLKEEETKLKVIFNSVQTGIVVIDPQTHQIVDVNPVAAELIGEARENIIGEQCHRFICPAEKGRCPVTDLGNTIDNSERILITSGGEQRAVIKTVVPVSFSGRNYLLESFTDITDRKQTEEALRESESKFRDLAEKSLAGIYLIQDGIFQYVNAKFGEILGYTIDELIGKMTVESVIYQDDWPLVRENLRKRISGEVDSLNYEFRAITKTGEIRDAEIYSSRTMYKGKPAVIGTLLDITERKNSEKVLRESEARLRQVIDLVPHFIFAKDENGRFIFANKAVADAYGTTFEELTGKTDANFNKNEEEVVQFVNDDLQVIRSGLPKEIPEEKITTSRGDVRILHTIKMPFSLSMTGGEAVLGVSTDITERKLTEKALYESEDKYRNIFENAVEGIFQSTPGGELITVNRALARMTGYETPEEMMSTVTNLGKIYVQPERRSEFRRLLHEEGSVEAFQVQIYRKEGGIIWASMNARAAKGDDGSIIYYEGTIEDITKAKKAEEALLRSEEELRALIGSINDTIMIVDGSGKCIKVPTMSQDRLFGPAGDVVGKSFKEIFPEETARFFLKNIHKALKSRQTVNIEYCMEIGEQEYWFSTAISPMTRDLTVCVARDITDLKSTEKKLEAKSITLEETNAALKVLLKNMEGAKKELEENIVSNIKMLVMPCVEKMKKLRPNEIQKTYIDLVETNLKNIASPFLHDLGQFNLTPTEIQIASYIKEGRTTKDIMELLHTSKDAIDIHRYNIRKKLGINKKKVNLHSHLLSIR